jgi:hypothetical protein
MRCHPYIERTLGPATNRHRGGSSALDETGVDALRQHLKDTVTGRKVPAAWFGVTSANEELFFDCQGERVFGKPNEGMVDEHTSGFRLVDRTDPSPTAVLDDQVCHDGECHV